MTTRPAMSREQALSVLSRWFTPTMGEQGGLEADWETWIRTLFGRWVSDKLGNPIAFAEHHKQIWEWFWAVRLGIKQDPLIAILPRGGAKSTTAEMGIAALAARRTRSYGLYISATQAQSDDHVQNVGALLESPKYAEYYPAAANKRVNKYGYSSGWNRQRLRTASGFTLDSIGLDTAARGVKLEETRPDFLVLDDIDKELDTPEATDKKIKLITTAFLPAGSSDLIVFGIQNLVIEDGVFARLGRYHSITKAADFLQNRIVIGPMPAVENAQVVIPVSGPREGKYTLIGGTPTWAGQGMAKAQADIDEWGFSAWDTEAQQNVELPAGGLFSGVDFDKIQIPYAEYDALLRAGRIVRTVVWCDPAVTSTDHSDSHGVQADALGTDDVLYRLRSWEGKETPDQVLRRAITWALELGADHVGVETDQGGDLWEMAFQKVWDEMCADNSIAPSKQRVPGRPAFRAEKAGAGYGSKAHRGSLMLRDYQSAEHAYGVVRHVVGPEGYHLVLRRGLGRAFVKKPFDLADAAFWAWFDLKGSVGGGVGAASDEPLSKYGSRAQTVLGRQVHSGQPGGPDNAYSATHSDRQRPLRDGRLWGGHRGGTLWRGLPPASPNGGRDGADEVPFERD